MRLRPTPQTDAYDGTHETHKIDGRTIYEHARTLERERDDLKEQLIYRMKQIESLERQLDNVTDDYR